MAFEEFTTALGIRWILLYDGFADSNLGVPRSQGGRTILMNNAAITMTSKRHTTTDDSTLAAELTEAHFLACEIEGLRVLMDEIGLKQARQAVCDYY